MLINLNVWVEGEIGTMQLWILNRFLQYAMRPWIVMFNVSEGAISILQKWNVCYTGVVGGALCSFKRQKVSSKMNLKTNSFIHFIQNKTFFADIYLSMPVWHYCLSTFRFLVGMIEGHSFVRVYLDDKFCHTKSNRLKKNQEKQYNFNFYCNSITVLFQL